MRDRVSYQRTRGSYEFKVEDFFPYQMFKEITEVRINNPQAVQEEAASRQRRAILTEDGKLAILAVDHPARGNLVVEDNPVRMGDRYDLLGRLLRIMITSDFDGIMATPEVIEELFILNFLHEQKGGESFLDNKVIIGCMNRGGTIGTVFQMDDRMTAFTAQRIKMLKLDGAKVMFMLDPSNPDSGKAIYYCSQAITECSRLDIPVFVEPMEVRRIGNDYRPDQMVNDVEVQIKLAGIGAGLGETSLGTWLKIAHCVEFERVVRATTCPILMLDGLPQEDPTETMEEYARGMKAGAKGVLVGKNVLYTGKDDPLAIASAIANIVHKGFTAAQAIESLAQNRGKNIAMFTAEYPRDNTR